MRKLENKEYIVYKDFIKMLEKEINRIIKRNKDLLSHLRIRGVQIMGISVEERKKPNCQKSSRH